MDFYHILLLIHIGFGEFAGLCFLWVTVDTLNRNEAGLSRIKYISAMGAISAILAWFAGGYYYVKHYGTVVKPVLIAETSNLKWAHKVIIEAKEHVFLFIPVLAVAVFLIYYKAGSWSELDETTSKKTAVLSLLIFLLAFLMAAMGATVSGSVRTLIGGGV